MIVTRKDLFDFRVLLTEDEFNDIKVVSDYDNTPLEEILATVIEYGLNVIRNGKDEQET